MHSRRDMFLTFTLDPSIPLCNSMNFNLPVCEGESVLYRTVIWSSGIKCMSRWKSASCHYNARRSILWWKIQRLPPCFSSQTKLNCRGVKSCYCVVHCSTSLRDWYQLSPADKIREKRRTPDDWYAIPWLRVGLWRPNPRHFFFYLFYLSLFDTWTVSRFHIKACYLSRVFVEKFLTA